MARKSWVRVISWISSGAGAETPAAAHAARNANILCSYRGSRWASSREPWYSIEARPQAPGDAATRRSMAPPGASRPSAAPLGERARSALRFAGGRHHLALRAGLGETAAELPQLGVLHVRGVGVVHRHVEA